MKFLAFLILAAVLVLFAVIVAVENRSSGYAMFHTKGVA